LRKEFIEPEAGSAGSFRLNKRQFLSPLVIKQLHEAHVEQSGGNLNPWFRIGCSAPNLIPALAAGQSDRNGNTRGEAFRIQSIVSSAA
jgi:hypothetical protein